MGKLATLLTAAVLVGSVCADWRQTGNYYQIYPRSFQDSNGDGIGDLRGVASKVKYLKDLGMDGVWLSPIMKSPMADFGYDISDYYQIHEEYGTMEDFDYLLAECKKVGLRLILDFVPNHTSDESDWFLRDSDGDPDYEDFYIWHPGSVDLNGNRVPPNNWVSVFRFSAWTWNERRGAFYLHQFAEKQPDLNYRNPKVVEAMKEVIRFWLKKGVSGFRIDAVPFLFEIAADAEGNYPDEPESGECDDPMSYCYLKHIYTQDQDETFDMAYQWRAVTDEFEDRVLLIEAYTSLTNIMRLYGDGKGRDGAHIPFNFELLSNVFNTTSAREIHAIIERWNNALPAGRSSNWVLGNHDNKRLSSRLGLGRADLYNMLLQLLPGNAVTYQGEEICMPDGFVSWEDTVDVNACNTNSSVYLQYSRDPARTPMQWDDSKNAGFSTADKTWLPVGESYKTVNVKAQEAAASSSLKLFKTLTKLRKEPVFQNGDYKGQVLGNDVLAFSRSAGNDTAVVLLNFGTSEQTVDLSSSFSSFKSGKAKVRASTPNLDSKGDLDAKSIKLPREAGVVVVVASSSSQKIASFFIVIGLSLLSKLL